MFDPHKPLIVQSDFTVLVDLSSARYEDARAVLALFAELEKSPEHVHTYRITPLSLWNAAAGGLDVSTVLAALDENSKYEVPGNVRRDIVDLMSRYGRLRLISDGDRLLLESDDHLLITEIANRREVQAFIIGRPDKCHIAIAPSERGTAKQTLLQLGFPVEDLAGYLPGESLELRLREEMRSTGQRFALRAYQSEAVNVFYAGGSERGGSGVIVLPCGAGKTVIGMAIIAEVAASTLILTPSTVAVRQWIDELIDKTDVNRQAVGEYTGQLKEIRPITISTYQTMTYRPRKTASFPHLSVFNERDWGLIIYDEVHLLPAPVFRATAGIQARRRLGLTATLIREDGRAGDVFSLIGPKKYDVPWKQLEAQGWIAAAECAEIRLPLPDERRLDYALAPERDKYRIAATNPQKLDTLGQLLEAHESESVLVIGQYLDQLRTIADQYDIPLITGKTAVAKRRELYAKLRSGEIKQLVVSKVGNFSIDLPDVSVAIQVSGTFGSRQEEAQRLGRILRPKASGAPATFYTIVSRDTIDQEYAARRQMFLTERGYRYHIAYEDEVDDLARSRAALAGGTDGEAS